MWMIAPLATGGKGTNIASRASTGESPESSSKGTTLRLLDTQSPTTLDLVHSDVMTDKEQAELQDTLQRRTHDVAFHHWAAEVSTFQSIKSDLLIHDGRPIIADNRVSVSTIIGYLTLGAGLEALQRDYPTLTPEAIQQAVDFTLRLLEG